MAEIELPSKQTMQVYTCHTQSTNFDLSVDHEKLVQSIRENAFREIVTMINKHAGKCGTVLLAGDFNVQRDLLYKSIRD